MASQTQEGAGWNRAELLARLEPAARQLADDGAASLEELRARLIEQVLSQLANPSGELLSPRELGHAYEQVLDVRLERAPGGAMTLVACATARRQQGSYYTPEFLAAEIVRRTLAPLLASRAGSPEAILELRILDPAVGCGAFLIASLEALTAAAGPPQDRRLRGLIAARCLFGADSDLAAVRVARLALARAVDAEASPTPELTQHVRWGDALTGAPGEHPPCIRWDLDFPGVFVAAEPTERWFRGAPLRPTGFDAVVGNPPYLQEARGNKELFRSLRRSPWVAAHCERMTDLFHLFLSLSLTLLKDGGRLGMIVPDYWLSRTGASHVRADVLARRLEQVVLFGGISVFSGAPGHHSSIILIDNRAPLAGGALAGTRVLQLTAGDVGEQLRRGACDSTTVRHAFGRFLVLSTGAAGLLERLAASDHFFLERGSVSNGLQTYPDRVDGAGVFVLTREELTALGLNHDEAALAKPFVLTRDIQPYQPARPSERFVLYIDTAARALVEANVAGRYDRLRAHLGRFREHITSVAAPYGIHRPRRAALFTAAARLVIPRKAPRVIVAPVEQPLYGDESLNFLMVPDGVSRDGLLGVLASSLAHWFCYIVKRQGEQLQVDTEVLLRFPLPLALRDQRSPTVADLENTVRAARSVTGDALAELELRIDLAVARLYGFDRPDRDFLDGFRVERAASASRRAVPSTAAGS